MPETNDRIAFPACPLCDSVRFAFFKEADCSKYVHYSSELSPTIRWNKCADCGHIFTEGYYTDAALRILFARAHAGQRLGENVEGLRPVAADMIERVLPYVSEGRWLDIGVGNGALLLTAREFGFTPVGTDLRAENVEVLKRLGVEAHAVDIVDLRLEAKCSVISMADVLEHIPYPKDTLAKAHALLVDGGVLLVSMPNLETVIWEVLDRKGDNPYWGEMEHYHNFGRTRLYALLREAGFEPRSYGVSKRYRSGMEIVAQKI